jgi:hypothetical protein
MKQRITGNWTTVRFLRFLIGSVAVVQGIVQREVVVILAGLFVFMGAILNFGCCGSAGCPVTYPTNPNEMQAGEKKINPGNIKE